MLEPKPEATETNSYNAIDVVYGRFGEQAPLTQACHSHLQMTPKPGNPYLVLLVRKMALLLRKIWCACAVISEKQGQLQDTLCLSCQGTKHLHLFFKPVHWVNRKLGLLTYAEGQTLFNSLLASEISCAIM